MLIGSLMFFGFFPNLFFIIMYDSMECIYLLFSFHVASELAGKHEYGSLSFPFLDIFGKTECKSGWFFIRPIRKFLEVS